MLLKVFFHPLLSVLSEKSHHHPGIKFTRIKGGRGRMKRCTFSPFPVMNPVQIEKEFLLTILFVIGVYLLRKLLDWRELGEVSWSKHKLEINLSACLLVVSEGPSFSFLSLSDILLLCTSGGNKVNSCFLSCWVLAVAAVVWYSFLAADIKNIAHWVYLELSFLFWSYTELHYCKRKLLGPPEILSKFSD